MNYVVLLFMHSMPYIGLIFRTKVRLRVRILIMYYKALRYFNRIALLFNKINGTF